MLVQNNLHCPQARMHTGYGPWNNSYCLGIILYFEINFVGRSFQFIFEIIWKRGNVAVPWGLRFCCWPLHWLFHFASPSFTSSRLNNFVRFYSLFHVILPLISLKLLEILSILSECFTHWSVFVVFSCKAQFYNLSCGCSSAIAFILWWMKILPIPGT